MDSNTFRNLSMYFPFVAKLMISCSESLVGWTVKLSNGEHFLYDDLERTIRRLPADSMDLSVDEFKKEFGKRLYKIMQNKHITQDELCKKVGISQPALSNYVSGKTVPGFYVIDKIAKALDCSADEFRYLD